ncbi:MAG: SRPBCC family protein [Chloroflexota bacterium]
MRVATSFPTRLAPERAHAYVADFATIAEWDPLIRSAERLDPGPPRVGSRYHLVARGPLGRAFGLDYVITDLEPPHRVRLDASSGTRFDGWDEITCMPVGDGGATVHYAAEINLHGVGRLLYLVMPVMWLVGRLRGRGPLDGLRRRLDELAAIPGR